MIAPDSSCPSLFQADWVKASHPSFKVREARSINIILAYQSSLALFPEARLAGFSLPSRLKNPDQQRLGLPPAPHEGWRAVYISLRREHRIVPVLGHRD